MVGRLIKKLFRRYFKVVQGVIDAGQMDDISQCEINLITAVFLPLIVVAAVMNIPIGYMWNMPMFKLVMYTLFLGFVFCGIIFVSKMKNGKLRMHLFSILLTISMFVSFYLYYNKLHILFWLIPCMITIFSCYCIDRTLLYYMVCVYPVLYCLRLHLVEKSQAHDYSYNIILFALLFHFLLFAVFCNYLYRTVIINKLEQYAKIKQQKEQILKLYKRLLANEKSLKKKNKNLHLHNQEIRATKEKLEHLVNNDVLTGAANRKKIVEQLHQLVISGKKSRSSFALVFIDFDNFKKVNDSLGHMAGDFLLIEATERLMKVIHKDDMLGRLGGDELAVLVQREETRQGLYEYVQSLCNLFQESFFLEGVPVKVTASFGIAVFPDDGADADDLLRSADTAMYNAKQFGKNNVQFYNQELKNEGVSKMELETVMVNALENQEFYLEYQPIFSNNLKTVVGLEALLRWKTKDNVNISPDEFIPIAEENGLIHEIGEWVIRQACRKIKEIKTYYDEQIMITVNVSIVQMKSDNFLERVKYIIEAEGVSPSAIEFEIKETAFQFEKARIVRMIQELSQYGIRITMDDFGTGYSSLHYFLDFPIDKLKIDRSFLYMLEKDSKRYYVIKSVISMLHNLNISVTAEGIETEEQLDYLTKGECDLFQGYILSRPLENQQVEEFLIQANQ